MIWVCLFGFGAYGGWPWPWRPMTSNLGRESPYRSLVGFVFLFLLETTVNGRKYFQFLCVSPAILGGDM